MYKPIQVPHILDKKFKESVCYEEDEITALFPYVICMWTSTPRKEIDTKITNIIVADACIDLVVNWSQKQIGFAGMKQTDFSFEVNSIHTYFGLRMQPGAFQCIFKMDATSAMDTFLPLSDVDKTFDVEGLFHKSLQDAKKSVIQYVINQVTQCVPSNYMNLFQDMYQMKEVQTVERLSNHLGYSRRQLSRLFLKYYGIQPKVILSIIRFQKALDSLLKEGKYDTNDYYDQSHYIKDVKLYIGITPQELIQIYQT